MKVTKHTRAPRNGNGKIILCPTCNIPVKVYHFSWCAVTCDRCEKLVDKFDWNLEDETRYVLLEKQFLYHN